MTISIFTFTILIIVALVFGAFLGICSYVFGRQIDTPDFEEMRRRR